MNRGRIVLLLSYSLYLALGADSNGFQANFFVPDIITKKSDPFNLISSNFGQPAGDYNWNTDQFKLMNRSQGTCNGCTQNGKHVIIQDLKLYVKDVEYYVQAMCYNPVPLGIASMVQTSGTGGGGLCSSRRTPFASDDYKSACYDSDFFDGGSDPNRVPAGPVGGWFDNIWARDLPVIKQSGANTLRIYNSNPTTYLYTQAVISGKQTAITGNIVAPPVGKDHRPFMDAAAAYGLMVIYPLIGDENLMTNLDASSYERLIQNQIDEIGDHPALLMYTLGNELNVASDPQLLQLVNGYINFARNYSLSRWGRMIPITHAIVDDPFTYNALYAELQVDIFTSNAGYRGLGFGDLWDGTQTPGFSGLGPLSTQYNKPNFIGEMGWQQINGSQTADPVNAGWFNLKWKDLLQKGAPAGCIGGAFFEYSDEPFSKADPTQQSMGIVSLQVSTSSLQETVKPIPSFTQAGGNTLTNANSGFSQGTVNTGQTQSGQVPSVGGETQGGQQNGASGLIAGILAALLPAILL